MTATRYIYEVRGPETFAHYNSLRAAKAGAAVLASEGHVVDIYRWVAGTDGDLLTNIGGVHTAFPRRADERREG